MPRKERTFLSRSESDTYRFGERIAKDLTGGGIVLLRGPLGSGKTVLARGLSAGLGVDPREVRSPSFTLVNEYRGRLAVHHVDLFRIRDESELDELGLDEIFGGTGVSLVEWPERLGALLPAEALEILLEDLGGDRRRLRVRWRAGEAGINPAGSSGPPS